MKKILIAAIMFLIFPITVVASHACEMMGEHGMMGKMMGMGDSPWFHHGVTLTLKNAEKLGLDDKQKSELDGIRDTYTKEIIRQDAELKIAEMEIGSLLKGENIDLAKVKDTIKKTEDLQAQIRYMRIEAFVEARKVLTDEQKGKLKQLIDMPPMPMKKQGMKGGMMGGIMEGMDCPMMGGMMEGRIMGGMDKEKGKNTAQGKEAKADKGQMTQEKKAGEVTVIATLKNPEGLGKKDDLIFSIKFDTHSENLDAFKFNQGIILKDDKGKTYKPVSVKETGSGHHREAEVKFKNTGKVKSLELIVKDLAGVKESIFKWQFPD